MITTDKIIVLDTGEKGRSLFATRDIMKDELIVIVAGPIVAIPTIYTVPIESNLFIDPVPFENPVRYLCHGCSPNAGIKKRSMVVAYKNILKGEEILLDYAMIVFEYGPEMTTANRVCQCHATNCRGVLGSWKELPAEQRQLYDGYVSDYLYKLG